MTAGFRRSDRPVVLSGSHSVPRLRPVLESLEARLLLSGGLERPVLNAVPDSLSQYGPIQPGSPTKDGLGRLGDADPAESSESSATKPSQIAARAPTPVGSARMMVYGGDDASTTYPVKTYGATSVPEGPSSYVPFVGHLDFATSAAPAVQVTGSINAYQSSYNCQLTVGPDVAGLRLVVNPRGSQPYDKVPAFDGVVLYDGDGRKLAEMNVHEDPARPVSSTLLVSFENAPAGSIVVVRISSMSAAGFAQTHSNLLGLSDSDDLPSDSTLPSASGESAFVLTIQALERSSPPEETSGGSDGIINQPKSGPDLSSAGPASVLDGLPGIPSQGTPDPEEEAPIPSPTTSTPAATVAINVRIPTGPLIYRGSTPLGGILAASATILDPTPAIDRHDGSLAAYLDGLIDEGDLLSARERLEAGSEAVVDIRGIKRNRGDCAVAGTTLGNLPLVASRLMESPDHDQATALLASLPSPTTESPVLSPIVTQVAIDLVSTKPPEETQIGESAATWASTAVGLTLGLTLTSGPYFPDLLNHARRGTPRRFRRFARRFGDGRPSPR